jgi:hypothetical protein
MTHTDDEPEITYDMLHMILWRKSMKLFVSIDDDWLDFQMSSYQNVQKRSARCAMLNDMISLIRAYLNRSEMHNFKCQKPSKIPFIWQMI